VAVTATATADAVAVVARDVARAKTVRKAVLNAPKAVAKSAVDVAAAADVAAVVVNAMRAAHSVNALMPKARRSKPAQLPLKLLKTTMPAKAARNVARVTSVVNAMDARAMAAASAMKPLKTAALPTACPKQRWTVTPTATVPKVRAKPAKAVAVAAMAAAMTVVRVRMLAARQRMTSRPNLALPLWKLVSSKHLRPTPPRKASVATNPAKSVHATVMAVTVDHAATVATVVTALRKPALMQRNRSLTSPAPRLRKTHRLHRMRKPCRAIKLRHR